MTKARTKHPGCLAASGSGVHNDFFLLPALQGVLWKRLSQKSPLTLDSVFKLFKVTDLFENLIKAMVTQKKKA